VKFYERHFPYSIHKNTACPDGSYWVGLRESDHLGHPGVDGRIILKWDFKKWDGGIDWIELAQDRERWRALLDAVINLQVP
jgi:hypothetical protein